MTIYNPPKALSLKLGHLEIVYHQLIKSPEMPKLALQSCKYNIDGTVDLTKGSEVFYQYIGETLDGTSDPKVDMDSSTALPIKSSIYNGKGISELSISQFADKVEETMNKDVYHPMFRDLCECSVKRDATTSVFEGLIIIIKIMKH